VAATFHGDEKTSLAGKRNSLHNIICRLALSDQGGPFVEHAIPDRSCGIVATVIREKQLTLQRVTQFLYGGRCDG